MNQVMVKTQNQVQARMPLVERINEAKAFAAFMIEGGIAPECYGKKNDQGKYVDLVAATNAMALVMIRGREIGITYNESIAGLYPVKNVVSAYAKTLVYLFTQRGGKVELLEWDSDHCKIRVSQRGKAALVSGFTLAECKQAGWNMEPDGKGGSREKYTWTKMPRVMVLKRTITNVLKAYAPEIEFINSYNPDLADGVEVEELEAGDDTVESDGFRVIEQAPATDPVKALGVDDIPDEKQQPVPGSGFFTWPIPKQNRFTKFMKDHGLSVSATCEELDVKTLNDWQYSSGQTAPILEALSYQETLSLADKKAALRINKLAQIVWFGFTIIEIKEAIDAYIASKVTEIQVEAVTEQEGMAI